MKDMISKMDSIETPKPKFVTESASMNISMTADDAGQVGQLMSMMRNAGMRPEPVSDMPLSPRMDMEKHMAAMDDPKIPGKDDVPGDMDLKAGVMGKLAGGALGSTLAPTGAALGSAGGAALGNMIAPGVGGAVGSAIGGALGGAAPVIGGAELIGGEDTDEGTYANEPDEKYSTVADVTRGGNDLNKPKKTYPKVSGGDNPMAGVKESIKDALMNMYQEYKVDEAKEDKKDVALPSGKTLKKCADEGMSKADIMKRYKDCDKAKLEKLYASSCGNH